MPKHEEQEYRSLHVALAETAAADAEIFTSAQYPYFIAHVNAAWCRLCGWESREVIGQTCRLLQGPETSKEALKQLNAAIVQRRKITVRLLNYTKQGAPFINDLTVEPLVDEHRGVTHFRASLQGYPAPPGVRIFPRVFEGELNMI